MVGALLDAEAPDEFINNLILSVRSLIPVEALCAEVEKRNRLKLLNPFLEHLVSEGSQVPIYSPPPTPHTFISPSPPLSPHLPTESCMGSPIHPVHCTLGREVMLEFTHNRWTLLLYMAPTFIYLVCACLQDPHVHDALGKIIIDGNNSPEHFLTTNPFYDSLVVGKYAEKRDPHLACVAYKRGQCDEALLSCTNRYCSHFPPQTTPPHPLYPSYKNCNLV